MRARQWKWRENHSPIGVEHKKRYDLSPKGKERSKRSTRKHYAANREAILAHRRKAYDAQNPR